MERRRFKFNKACGLGDHFSIAYWSICIQIQLGWRPPKTLTELRTGIPRSLGCIAMLFRMVRKKNTRRIWWSGGPSCSWHRCGGETENSVWCSVCPTEQWHISLAYRGAYVGIRFETFGLGETTGGLGQICDPQHDIRTRSCRRHKDLHSTASSYDISSKWWSRVWD